MKNIFNSLDEEGFFPKGLIEEVNANREEVNAQILNHFELLRKHYNEDDIKILYDVWNEMSSSNCSDFFLMRMYEFVISKFSEMLSKKQYFEIRTFMDVFSTSGVKVFAVSIKDNIEFLHQGFPMLIKELDPPDSYSSFHYNACRDFLRIIQKNDRFLNENLPYIERFKKEKPELYDELIG